MAERKASSDLLEKKAVELFIVRRRIARLQAEENRLVNSIGRKKEYEGLRKLCHFRAGKKILLTIDVVRPSAIPAGTLFRLVSRRKGFSVKQDFFDMLVVSIKKVRERFGKAFAERVSYTRGRIITVNVKEVESKK